MSTIVMCLLVLTLSLSLSSPSPSLSTENVDFQPQSVQLTFPPTNQSILDDLYQLPVSEQLTAPLPLSGPQCSHVAILDDDILEETESKLLRLTLSMGGTHVQFADPSTTYVTIIDDDGKITKSVNRKRRNLKL